MYPLLFQTPVRETLWGGTRLTQEFGFECNREACGEVLLLSARKEKECSVKNGKLKGLTLDVVFKKYPADFGIKNSGLHDFPVFVKLIDAKDNLPLTVADRGCALYIADAAEDAQIIYGFNRTVSDEEIQKRIKTNTLSAVCNYIKVNTGDMIPLPAGLFHAVGKGVLAVMTEPSECCTYTVSDYGRVNSAGEKTALDIQKALKIIDLHESPAACSRIEDTMLYPFGTVTDFPSTESFCSQLIRLEGTMGVFENESFISLIILSGEVIMSYSSGTMHLVKGDSVLIPADTKVKLTGSADIICTHT